MAYRFMVPLAIAAAVIYLAVRWARQIDRGSR
jgi:hypothetical protein